MRQTLLPLFLLVLLLPFAAQGQITVSPTLPRHTPALDTAGVSLRTADSLRVLDSLEQVRRQRLRGQTTEWSAQGVASDTWDLTLLASAFGRIKAGDLVEYFSETVGRENPKNDRTALAGLDRYFELSVLRKFEEQFGVGAGYNFMSRYNRTTVESSSGLPAGDRELDVTYHLLTIRTLLPLYGTGGARFALSGGFGPELVYLTERDIAARAERTASKLGLGIAFDAIGNFEVFSHVRFTLDVYIRSNIVGEFKNDAGESFSAPFGSRTTATSIAPIGNSALFGLAIGTTVSL